MRLLVDTHLLLWSMAASRRLPPEVRALLMDPRNTILFSAASIWEIAIKGTLGRKDFRVDLPELLRETATTGFVELPIAAAHAARVADLPGHHKDPFDRLLIAQAMSEAAVLLTNDEQLKAYGGSIRVY